MLLASTFGAFLVAIAVAQSVLGRAEDRSATFTWTMPSRLELNVGSGRLPTYPQSAVEVDRGPFDVDLALRRQACAPGVRRRWTVEAEPARPERAPGDCDFRLLFEGEGKYDIKLHVEGGGHDSTFKQRVVVQDLLIVAIGDSIASGEGNPDSRSFLRPVWENKRCHRSALAGMARAAAHVEDADTKSSVTFVHLACSGATVTEGLIGPSKGAQPGLFPRPRLLPPQVDGVRAVGRKRRIDAVLLSVGANDVGFANIVSFCLVHNNCSEKRIDPEKVGLRTGPKLPLAQAVAVSLDQLSERYAALDTALPKSLHRKRVHVLEYFDPTHEAPGVLCDRILGEIRSDEIEWAYRHVIVPLNKRVRAAARGYGWRYISGVANAFARHGMCAGPDRWVRRLDESLAGQGLNHKGTLHPNEEGHGQIAELIERSL